MKSAYNHTWLRNLEIVKEAKSWRNHKIISAEQFKTIAEQYPSNFYHPNLMIRILLFIASFIGLFGVIGLIALMFEELIDEQYTACALGVLLGIACVVVTDRFAIAQKNHYKSGITELLIYAGLLCFILGVTGFTDWNNERLTWIVCLITLSFAAYRYIDLLCTAASMLTMAGYIFFELYGIGGMIQNLIPIFFIVLFTPFYFFIRKLKSDMASQPWENPLILLEAMSALLIYAAGNYFVVRELSQELLGFYLQDGEDIPFAFLFYGLTVIIPLIYLYFALKKKDVVLLRVSLIAIAFSVFTFKYYFSLNRPEFTLTLAGVVILGITLYLFRYLRTPKFGYTREQLLSEKWADTNAQAFIVSQTLGGNTVAEEPQGDVGGGGAFSGGGSTDGF
jgi:hypothetical protein